MEDQLLTPRFVSNDVGKSTKTLSAWRGVGTGPPSVKVGGSVRYPRGAYYAWKRQVITETLRGDGVVLAG
ncbi:hypothetical protein SAMN04489765_3848 [Tsukamurella pulmonis]|uniref:Helix-turn-helix domain-containing protein n=1 Tax=Tsukamurella pulmonis TaxID=47312 RepID=A0A1H1H733_9ACTN|nr:hypothetical protein SAMN04489765_3848 [Tsukamurella pulmonis]SUP15843.1 Uncharacterised protein [Tsukamurella pulmonis]